MCKIYDTRVLCLDPMGVRGARPGAPADSAWLSRRGGSPTVETDLPSSTAPTVSTALVVCLGSSRPGRIS